MLIQNAYCYSQCILEVGHGAEADETELCMRRIPRLPVYSSHSVDLPLSANGSTSPYGLLREKWI